MGKQHGWFVPEMEFLVDMKGLINYLSETIQVLHQCLYCHKQVHTSAGVQTHMRDRGHCMIAYSTEDEQMDVGEFYDFRATYEDSDTEGEDEETEGGVQLLRRPPSQMRTVRKRPTQRKTMRAGRATDQTLLFPPTRSPLFPLIANNVNPRDRTPNTRTLTASTHTHTRHLRLYTRTTSSCTCRLAALPVTVACVPTTARTCTTTRPPTSAPRCNCSRTSVTTPMTRTVTTSKSPALVATRRADLLYLEASLAWLVSVMRRKRRSLLSRRDSSSASRDSRLSPNGPRTRRATAKSTSATRCSSSGVAGIGMWFCRFFYSSIGVAFMLH
jgi:hypothetical protein